MITLLCSSYIIDAYHTAFLFPEEKYKYFFVHAYRITMIRYDKEKKSF